MITTCNDEDDTSSSTMSALNIQVLSNVERSRVIKVLTKSSSSPIDIPENRGQKISYRNNDDEFRNHSNKGMIMSTTPPVMITSLDELPVYSLKEISLHDNLNDCWVVIYDRVYDITTFIHEHPGGDEILLEYAGRDATLAFRSVGHSKMAEVGLEPYLVGALPTKEQLWTRLLTNRVVNR